MRQFDSSGNVTDEFSSQWFADDATSDLVMANAPYNTRGTRNLRNGNDGIYNTQLTDGSIAGARLLLNLTQASSGAGYTGTFNVILQI